MSNNEHEITLGVLNAVHDNSKVTQRSLAGELVGDGSLAGKRRPIEGKTLPWALRCATVFEGTRLRALGGSVHAWLGLHGRAMGIEQGEIDRCAELVGLSARLQAPVQSLSSGMQERLLLARAALATPDVVLIDHPLAHLDAAGEEALAAWVSAMRARRACLLWVSNDRRRIERYGDRWALLAGGRVHRVIEPDPSALQGVVP